MKIIDKKGKFLGLINIFDLFVLTILILSIFFAVRWIFIAEDPSWIKVKLLHARCVAVIKVPSYMVDLIKDGDTAIDNDGLVAARIDKILEIKPDAIKVFSSKDGEKLFFDSEKVSITVILDLLSYEKNKDMYSCITSLPIKVGGSILINANKYSIKASIRKILPTIEK